MGTSSRIKKEVNFLTIDFFRNTQKLTISTEAELDVKSKEKHFIKIPDVASTFAKKNIYI